MVRCRWGEDVRWGGGSQSLCGWRFVNFFFFKQKTAYEISTRTGVQTCALPILANMKEEKHSFNNLQTILFEDMEELWLAKKNEEEIIKKYTINLSSTELEETVECDLIGGNSVNISRSMIITHLVDRKSVV